MKRILIIVSDTNYFLSHRLAIACFLKEKGYGVCIAAALSQKTHLNIMKEHELAFFNLRRKSKGFNFFSEFYLISSIIRLVKHVQPDIVFTISVRMVFLSVLVSFFSFQKKIKWIGLLAGLGFLEISKKWRIILLKKCIYCLFSLFCYQRNIFLIVQNKNDFKLIARIINKNRLFLIRGSGVDIEKFKPVEKLVKDTVVVTMVSRMLKDKGVIELVDAMRHLQAQDFYFIKLHLVGDIDLYNPSSLSYAELTYFQSVGLLQWDGHQNDICRVYQETDIAVLPSYREGLPKSLLEATACGLPVVATDVPGCREICLDGINGILIQPQDSVSLARALLRLAKDSELRLQMGKESRCLVEDNFSVEFINNQYSSIFTSLLDYK